MISICLISDGDYSFAKLLLYSIANYDIKMGADIARYAHCNIAMGNEVASYVHYDVTMYNDAATNLYYYVLLYLLMILLFHQ